MITVTGFLYTYYQKSGYNNNNNNLRISFANINLNDIDIMNIVKAKNKLRNPEKLKIGYGIFNNRNELLDIVSILGTSLIVH